MEKCEVWLSEIEILNLGGDLPAWGGGGGGGLPDKKAGGWGWKGEFGERGVARLGAPPSPLHPPPLPHSQTFLLKFADKRQTKMAAPAYF